MSYQRHHKPDLPHAAVLAALLLLLMVAAYLRFDHLGAPSYWLDEILGVELTDKAAAAPWWRWLTGLEPEHGPLYYFTQLSTRLAGHDEAAGRLAAALFGLATLFIVFIASRRIGGQGLMAGLPATIILTASPLHVYYSREARPYALLLFLTAICIVVILKPPRLRIAMLPLLALLYTSAVAAPVLAALAMSAVGAAMLTPDRAARRRQWRIGLVAALLVLVVPLFYGRASSLAARPAAILVSRVPLLSVVRAFTVSSQGKGGRSATIVLLVLFALAGALSMVKRQRREALVLVMMTLLPPLFSVASLALLGHWFALRYLSPGLIGFVMLAGAGVSASGRWLSFPLRTRPPRAGKVFAAVVVIVFSVAIAADTWLAARREPFQKLDWRAIAETLSKRLHPGDLVIAAENWSGVCLRYYLHDLPPGARLVGLNKVSVAEWMTRAAPAAWLVSAGYSDETSVREWMCGFPLLMASPAEGLRLHYAPSANHFLRERSSLEEQRAVAYALGVRGFTLHIGQEDQLLIGQGWSGAEGGIGEEFRWAAAREVSLSIPRVARENRTIRFHAFAFEHSSLPQQTVRLVINGNLAGEWMMRESWNEYSAAAPANFWREGLNTLTFAFARATAPRDFVPGATDDRTLAAAFDRISVEDQREMRGAETKGATNGSIHLSADALFRTRSGWPSRYTRLPADRLNRKEIEALLGRMGFDPQTAWPRIARRELQLEDVAESVASDGACHDDRTFLRAAFNTIIERPPNGYEERELLERLRAGAGRAQIVSRILRAGDFRARVLKK